MTPTEIGPAITRLLMLTAGPIRDDDTATVSAAIAAFDDATSITELACTVAVNVAAKGHDHETALFIADTADLVAFGMIAHADEHGRPGLDQHLTHLPLRHRAWVTVSLLGYWRQACSIAADRALTRTEIPETAPQEGTR